MTDAPAAETALLAALDEIGAAWTLHRHKPIFTVEESKVETGSLPGAHTKNFFLKEKKGGYVLVTLHEDRKIKIKHLEKAIGARRLSFGSAEDLMEVLGVIPGSVTPFAAFNDRAGRARVVLDAQMMEHELLNFHPLHNAATIAVSPEGLLRFFRSTGHEPTLTDFDALEAQARDEQG